MGTSSYDDAEARHQGNRPARKSFFSRTGLSLATVVALAAGGTATIGVAVVGSAGSAVASPTPSITVTNVQNVCDTAGIPVHVVTTGQVVGHDYIVAARLADRTNYPDDFQKNYTATTTGINQDLTLQNPIGRESIPPAAGGTVTFILADSTTGQNVATEDGTLPPCSNGTPSSITVHVKSSSLDQSCSEGQVAQSGQLNLTQIGSDRPDSITVTLASPTDTVQVQLDKLAGKTAQYVVSLKDGQTISDATAVVPADWSGEFVLSHYGCTSASPSPSPTPTQTSCDSSKKDSDGSSKVWYSDLKWNGESDAQAALDAVQPGGTIVLTDDVNVPANCTSESFGALYLVPKTGNQVLLDSDTTVNGNKKSLTVTLPTVPNDLIACGTKYTLQYDSGVGEVLPIIGTDQGKTYKYGVRKFDNGYGTRTFTAPPCPTQSPTPTPTPTVTPTPTPTVTLTVTPSPTVTPTSSPSPTPSSSPTPAPTTQSPPATGGPTPNTINTGGGGAALQSQNATSLRGPLSISLMVVGGIVLLLSFAIGRRCYGARP